MTATGVRDVSFKLCLPIISNIVDVFAKRKLRQVRAEPLQHAALESVMHPDTALLGRDDAGVTQHPQVVRNGWLLHGAARREIALANVALLAQLQDDPQPGLVTERLEQPCVLGDERPPLGSRRPRRTARVHVQDLSGTFKRHPATLAHISMSVNVFGSSRTECSFG